MVENPGLLLEFHIICYRSKDMNISGFSDHTATSGCLLVSQTLVDTFFEFSVVVIPRLFGGILMLHDI